MASITKDKGGRITSIRAGTVPQSQPGRFGFNGVPAVIVRAATKEQPVEALIELCQDFSPDQALEPSDRIEAVRGAIAGLDARDGSLWMAGEDERDRKPRIDALTSVLRWKPTAAERDAAWAAEIEEQS